MSFRILLSLFVCFPTLLMGQNTGTILEELQSGRSVRLELMQQLHLSENGSSFENYPVFPDKLLPGEEEVRIGMQFKPDDCNGDKCFFRIEFEYVSYIRFPKRKNTLVEGRQMAPDIIDTRYLNNDFQPIRKLLDSIVENSLLVEYKGQNSKTLSSRDLELWSIFLQNKKNKKLEAIHLKKRVSETELPSAFLPENLKDMLAGLLSASWIKSCNYKGAGNFQSVENFYANFYRAILPPTETVLAGQIKNPIEDSIVIKFYKEGSWLRQWQDTVIRLNKDNAFYLNFPKVRPGVISVGHGYKTIRVYMEPGDNLFLNTDANAIYDSLRFNGNNANPSAFLRDFYHQMRGDTLYRSFDHALLEWDQLRFLQRIQNRQAKELDFLNTYPNLSSGFRRIYDREIRLYHAPVIWEGATRFFENKDLELDDAYLWYCHQLGSLLYRLPEQKHFDFSIFAYLRFHHTLMNGRFANNPVTNKDQYNLAKILLSGENVVRVGRVILLRNHRPPQGLPVGALPIYQDMRKLCKDSVLLKELEDYVLETNWPVEYRHIRNTLGTKMRAPDWAFPDQNGDTINLNQFEGQFLLLHMGALSRLPAALRDVDAVKLPGKDLPVVHLLWGDGFAGFRKVIGNQKGSFLYVDKTALPRLKEDYFVKFNSNHYYLIDPKGKVIVGDARLETPQIMKSFWQKINASAPDPGWTPEKWLQFWRIIGMAAVLIIVIGGLYIWRKHLNEQRERRRRQIMELELKGIRSQMNPHFLFNALSSIQNLIRNKNLVHADQYLTSFAGLVRQILRNSEREFITLAEELEAIDQYCRLEALRAPFNYSINVDEIIDAHNTYIPGMLIQPIVENAILHGLLPKSADRELIINIREGRQGLECEIIDNGIGIEAAKAQKHHLTINKKSYGITLVQNRLQLLSKNVKEAVISIKDRSTLNSKTTGTIVQFTMPIET